MTAVVFQLRPLKLTLPDFSVVKKIRIQPALPSEGAAGLGRLGAGIKHEEHEGPRRSTKGNAKAVKELVYRGVG